MGLKVKREGFWPFEVGRWLGVITLKVKMSSFLDEDLMKREFKTSLDISEAACDLIFNWRPL